MNYKMIYRQFYYPTPTTFMLAYFFILIFIDAPILKFFHFFLFSYCVHPKLFPLNSSIVNFYDILCISHHFSAISTLGNASMIEEDG